MVCVGVRVDQSLVLSSCLIKIVSAGKWFSRVTLQQGEDITVHTLVREWDRGCYQKRMRRRIGCPARPWKPHRLQPKLSSKRAREG